MEQVMSDCPSDMKVGKLMELLNSGTNLEKALDTIDEQRVKCFIKVLSDFDGRPNTRSCELARQYNGCMI